MKRIIINIDAFGKPTIEAEGYSGSSCQEATRDLEKLLSHNESDNTKNYKPDYYNENYCTIDNTVL